MQSVSLNIAWLFWIKNVLPLVFMLLYSFVQSQSFQSSDWCQRDNNANSSYWPSYLNDPKRAVFTYSTNKFRCTGTLINQRVKSSEIEQLFVTARHCLEDADYNSNWRFTFNYQSPDGDDNSVPDNTNINLTNRNGNRYLHLSTVTLIDEISLCDLAILKINTPIPPHYNPYYAGWSVSFGQLFQLPNYDIHHPRGDIKKVAETYTTTTETNYPCHLVTEVVDVILNFLFGWITSSEIHTRTVCSYVESPFYIVPF